MARSRSPAGERGTRGARAAPDVRRQGRTAARAALDAGQWGLLAACAIGFLLRAALLWQLHDHLLLQPGFGLDTDLYVALAGRVAGGDLTLAPGAYPAAPLYIYVLGAVFAVTGHSLLAARVMQILVGTAAVWFIGDAARRWYGPRAGVAAAVLAALCGPFAFNEVLILQSALDPGLVSLALWTLARRPGPRAMAWAGTGAAWAAVALNRPNALPFLAVVAAGIAWQFRRAAWRPAAAFVLGASVLLAPVAARNLAVTGELVLIASHGGFNFFVGNNPEADGTYRSVEGITPSSVTQAADARRVAERAAGRPLGDGEVSTYFYGRAWAWIRERPAAAVALLARKLRFTLSADEIALNYSYAYYRRDEPTPLAAMPAGAWLLVPLGLVGLVACAPRGDRAYVVWAAFVPVYALGVAVFFVSERYRLPLLVVLCSAAGGLLAAALGLAASRSWRRLAAGALAVLLAAAASWWPTGLDDGRGEERTAMAEALIRHGDTARGQELVDRVLPDHPRPAMLLFRAGRALQAARQVPAAVERYEQAMAREPRPEIRFFLGQCLLDQRRVAAALPHLEAAVAAGIRSDVAPFDLARALAATGQRAAAQDALARLRIPPVADTASFVAAGQLAEALGDISGAIGHYAVATERGDAPPQMVERLGVLLALSGRSREAITVLERGVRHVPGAASLHLNLAVALAQEGRIDEARARVAEALRLRPDYPQARALAERLEKP